MSRRTAFAVVLVALGTVAAASAAVLGQGDPGRGPAPTRIVSVWVGSGAGAAEIATGFTIAPDRVVTVAHVLERDAPLRVRAGAGPERRARLLRVDRVADLALLYVPLPGWRRFGARSLSGGAVGRLLLRRGRAVKEVDAPVRRRIDARISGPGGARLRRRPALELAARVRAGDSGAPLVTPDGRLAGVVFARSRRRAATAYAVDAAAVTRMVRAATAPQ